MKITNILYLFFILFLINEVSYSQAELYSIDHYSINDGLSQNYANSIYQDKEGFIWIGTQDGLNRFDGYEFVVFKHDPSNVNSLSDNYIQNITGSEDSCIFIINNDGLEKYNYKTNKFSNILKNRRYDGSAYSTKINAVFQDDEKNLWIRTETGIIRYYTEGNKFLEYNQKILNNEHISDYNYFSISEDAEKNLWTPSQNGLVKFDSKTNKFTTFKINENLKANEIFSVYIENPEKIWIGTKNGIYIFNPKTNKFKEQKLKHEILEAKAIFKDSKGTVWIGTKFGLLNKTSDKQYFEYFRLENFVNQDINVGNISNIIQDKSGIIWVSSDYGIFKIDSKKKKFNLYQKNKNKSIKFSSNTFYSIYLDDETKLLWLGTGGFGLNIFNRETKNVKILNSKNSILTSDDIYCIIPDKKGNIWIGTNEGPYIYSKKNKNLTSFSKYVQKDFDKIFVKNRISNILFEENNIWFSTANGLYKYNKGNITSFNNYENSLSSIGVFKAIKRNNEEIWLGTSNGLNVYNLKTDSFKIYDKDNHRISSNSVLTIFKSSDNTIWLGTGTGLNKYIPEKDSFIYYTSQSNGFANDFIYTISEDNKNNLWMSTNKGIIKFNPKTEEVTNFSVGDNLQSNEFNIGAVYFDKKNNEMFWGGINGLNSLTFKTIEKNQFSPKPVITKFIVNTKNSRNNILKDNKDEFFLKYKESSFEIYYAVLEYTHPEKNKFKYKFEESGEDWIDLGHKRSISFYHLSPGNYTFLVIGSNSDGVWNTEPTKLKIHISPPWWFSTIAYIIYPILFGVLIFGVVFLYNREIRNENKILHEKQKIADKVEKQREQLSVKNQSISESLRYASRIIDTMLPSKKYIKKLLPDYFILFMSKEIVSGDFYWVDETVDKTFVAAVDCTGHGVPGAFMSIIGLDILRNIILQGIDTPSEILDNLNNEIASIFSSDEEENDFKDGMDISIIAIHKYENIVEYAGSINQMFLIRDDNINEIKADRFSISPININRGLFKNHILEVKDNDMIYLFSDGYVDQFGGPDEKKFKYRRFRHMLLNNYKRPVEEQKGVLKRVINSWKGDLEQVDDILIIGIRIHSKK